MLLLYTITVKLSTQKCVIFVRVAHLCGISTKIENHIYVKRRRSKKVFFCIDKNANVRYNIIMKNAKMCFLNPTASVRKKGDIREE